MFVLGTLVHGWCRVANLTKNLEQVSGDASSCRYKCWILISWNSFGLTKCSFCYEESWSPWLVRISTHLIFELRALQNSITGLVTLIGQEQLQLPSGKSSLLSPKTLNLAAASSAQPSRWPDASAPVATPDSAPMFKPSPCYSPRHVSPPCLAALDFSLDLSETMGVHGFSGVPARRGRSRVPQGL
ncbi:hypothetical protein F2Q69_00054359 [Brassica cretica]|uniref:Uncharacterized protein n=1 Tax=Brassica cretica TaxID=69181 RepID=A0A8S9MZI4_BRACR|nr:hypothetical protein F2Q69_00054359 [Brassica cretica]